MTDCVTNHPGARILVCQDQDGQTTDIAQNLEHLGYHVVAVASTVLEAIRIAEEAKPDLILVDFSLCGEMHGIETAEKTCELMDVPVVFMTACAGDAILRRALKTEPYGCLCKPSACSRSGTHWKSLCTGMQLTRG